MVEESALAIKCGFDAGVGSGCVARSPIAARVRAGAADGRGHRLKAALIFVAVVFGGWLFAYGAMWNQL